ncbi:DUF1700 domain-containing protein [Marinilactibacillus psychrotolerans]|uniref:DUF1700 domain-containing protein n=1 Tax=Marinilactibacillus psychrotolerans TaxID=191770 RepID=UPI0038881D81
MSRNRIEFIKELSNQLSYIMKPNEVKELVDYYDEMILDLMEEGLSEEEAVSRLDSPEEIKESIKGTPLEINLPISKKSSPYLIALLILGFPLWGSLVLALGLIILSIYIVVWCIPLVTGAIGFAGLVGGIVGTVFSPLALMDGFHIGVTQLGVGMLLFGVGMLATMFTINISKKVIINSQNLTNHLKSQLLFKRSEKR